MGASPKDVDCDGMLKNFDNCAIRLDDQRKLLIHEKCIDVDSQVYLEFSELSYTVPGCKGAFVFFFLFSNMHSWFIHLVIHSWKCRFFWTGIEFRRNLVDPIPVTREHNFVTWINLFFIHIEFLIIFIFNAFSSWNYDLISCTFRENLTYSSMRFNHPRRTLQARVQLYRCR